MGQIARLDINVEWFLPEMEKREDERLSDKIVQKLLARND